MKYYNSIKSLFCGSLLIMAGAASLTSCTDWLEKEKEAVVAEDEAFKNFDNFQGYIEEIYKKIPDKEKVNYCTAWNFGDDAVHNPEGYAHMDHQVDLGNYRNWINNNQCWLNGQNGSLWGSAWYCIRKCNQGLEHIENVDKLPYTDDERDLLLGQLYFFRAWWHFELMCYFGGMPYVDKAFVDGQIPDMPRLSFQECADRCAEDLQKAYERLPLDWDTTVPGKKSAGKNELRINKFMALCYLGKVYLWAGSPLMKEFEKTKNGGVVQLFGASSNGKTYDYDKSYCQKAAQALGKALQMVYDGTVDYKLAEYKYSEIYDHERDENSETNYSDNFYTMKQGWKQPGTTEAIFRGVSFTEQGNANGSNWNCTKLFGPKVAGLVAHDNIIHQPTANLVDQYGMANGQPIYIVENGVYVLNPKSGFDPTKPFKDRDPRFYHDIIFDGFHYVKNIEGLSSAQKDLEYCSLYTGGAMRSVDNGSSTGYFIQKLVPHQCNEGDRWYDWDYAIHTYLPYMRLADVYLMYAEAMAGLAVTSYDWNENREYCLAYTAVGAINALRDRVNSVSYPMAHVPADFLLSRETFIDEVRRERAVELAFEGFRWCDLQRWLLLTEPPYTTKYSHEFDRAQLTKDGEIDYEWYKSHDPKDAKVANFHKKEIITRDFTSKHYWFPLPDKDVYLSEGFPQNPGW